MRKESDEECINLIAWYRFKRNKIWARFSTFMICVDTSNCRLFADVIPIESTRARFLQLIIDYFISYHVVPAAEAPEGNSYSPNGKDKSKKRKSRDAQYEGDPRYLLPLTFVANLYETLIREINLRLATVEGLQEKTFGVALEAAGGLYRRLVKKFPKSGEQFTTDAWRERRDSPLSWSPVSVVCKWQVDSYSQPQTNCRK